MMKAAEKTLSNNGGLRMPHWIFLLGFVLIKVVLQFVLVNPAYELHRDEFLHLDLANHLALGYETVPPMIAAVAGLIKLLGNGHFWVKLFPALFGALTILVAWLTVSELGGGLYARSLSAACLILSAFLRTDMLFQPNGLDFLAWTSAFLLIIRYINTREDKWLWWTGMAAGLGLLAKYNIAFLIIGIVAAIALTPLRSLFHRRAFYGAIGIALLVASPNILWQAHHGFPVIGHMRELRETQLVNVDRLNIVIEQFVYFAGAVAVWSAGLIALFAWPRFKPYRPIGWCYCLVMGFYLALRAKSYYAIGLYPVLIAFGAVWWESMLAAGWKRRLRWALALLLVLASAPLAFTIMPVCSPDVIAQNGTHLRSLGLLRWEDGRDHALPQDFADMLGWRELAEKTERAYEGIPSAERERTLVSCENYGQAGAINYYTRGRLRAVSFHTDYINWIPRLDLILNRVYVGQEAPEVARQHFKTVTLVDSVENPYARERGSRIYVLRQGDTIFTRLYYQTVEELRQ